MSFLATARIGVVGLGLTGQAVVQACRNAGLSVTAFDADLSRGQILAEQQAAELPEVEFHSHPDPEELGQIIGGSGVDLVVVSPGIPATGPLIKAITKANIPIWSEIELAWQWQANGPRPNVPWLAVTGTNGKTTTVGMTRQILQQAGYNALAVGNVGQPIITAVAEGKADYLVVELSSFQLHFTYSMQAQAAVCLNIAPDHLDWHGGFDQYAADKGRVYTGVHRACVYPVADELIRSLVADADVADGARAIGLSLGVPRVSELGMVEDLLIDRAFCDRRHQQGEVVACLADLAHLGPVGAPVLQDALAAASLCRASGIAPEQVGAGLRAFNLDPHRRALVTTYEQIDWVDDSKATNPHAALASFSAVASGKVVWIAGGDVKGADLNGLISAVCGQLRAVILLGKTQAEFSQALARLAPEVPTVLVDPDLSAVSLMDKAVALAQDYAQAGDTVLLAPAGASWDQFKDYKHRGQLFAEYAGKLRQLRQPHEAINSNDVGPKFGQDGPEDATAQASNCLPTTPGEGSQ